MSSYKVVLRRPELNQYLNSPKGEVGEYLEKRGDIMLRLAKRQVGVDTGTLRESIKMIHERVTGGQQLRIGSDMDYAYLHHEGTRPHIITPDKAEMLRFTSRGRVVYSRQVMHPGTKPNRYLSDQLVVVRTV